MIKKNSQIVSELAEMYTITFLRHAFDWDYLCYECMK